MAGPGNDALTGLPDRETFLGLLRRRLAATDRGEVAVTVFDVAGFRDVNNRRGHPAHRPGGVATEVALTAGTASAPAGEVAPAAEILLAEAESRA